MVKGIIGLFIAIVLIAVLLPTLYRVINEMSPGSSSTIVPILFGLILVLGVGVSRFFRER
jgi:hypothetical protein